MPQYGHLTLTLPWFGEYVRDVTGGLSMAE